jgi:L-cysteine:1D-myo-inositol 2-amino-2-deoxy-alpha-D-glucopyranoside ligase
MHVAMVSMDGHKMSKSLGNLVFVDALRREWDPRVIRLGIIAHHYRREWEWNTEIMPTAQRRLDAWVAASTGGGNGEDVLNAVRERLDDDLDTPGALAVIDAAAGGGVDVTDAAGLLGVRLDAR